MTASRRYPTEPGSFYGTSAASPHAAGAAAVVRQRRTGISTRAKPGTSSSSRAHRSGSGRQGQRLWLGPGLSRPDPGIRLHLQHRPGRRRPVSGRAGGGGIDPADRLPTAGCPLDAPRARPNWLNVAPASGSGSGVVGYTVEANPGPDPATDGQRHQVARTSAFPVVPGRSSGTR